MKKDFLLVVCMVCCCSLTFGKGQRVFKKEYIRSEMLKVAEWQLNHPKHDARDWTNATFYRGLYAAWKATGGKLLLDSIEAMGERERWEPYKRWYFADDIAICRTYMDLYGERKDKRILEASLDTINKFVSNPYPNWRNPRTPIKLWWCDALFMAPPVLVRTARITHNSKYLKYNDKYYHECYDLLYDKEAHLFYRDLSYVIKPDGSGKHEPNGKVVFWSRGNGWVLGGLAMILEDMPGNYSGRSFYEKLFREMSDRIVNLQQPDGLWRASLLDPDDYPGGEVSGSGLFCYALAWGIYHKLLKGSKYLLAVRKAWAGLNRCVDRDGRVGWVQPEGADPRKNFSSESWEVYGTGAYLLAGSEMMKLI